MNYKEFLSSFNLELDDLKRDARWLGCKVFNCKPSLVLEQEVNSKEEKLLTSYIKRLKNNEPLAHIINSAPFFGFDFYVDENVLIPRMETELLVEKIINENKNTKNLKILDVCTGSGCIAIALKKNLDCKVFALDYSEKALKIAKKNAQNHNADITFFRSDMFSEVNETFDIIVSNPPYIQTDEIKTLQNSVKNFEPILALDGGKDGLKFYKIIAENAQNYLKENAKLYLEIGYNQGLSVPKLLEKNFKDIQVCKDYDKNDRIVICKRR